VVTRDQSPKGGLYGCSDELLVLCLNQSNTIVSKDRGESGEMERLAVQQHPVHVENHGGKANHIWNGTLEVVLRDGLSRSGALLRVDQPWADAHLARLYDVFTFEKDLPLYLDLAERQGSRVLEVACGSGRVLVPLARAGCRVVGVDASPHMLELAQAKLNAGGLSAQLVSADMRNFQLPQHDFDLAIVAVKSFAYLTEVDDQLACLRAIYAHLRFGGLLALDLMNPSLEWLAAPTGSMQHDLLQHVPERGFSLSRVESVVSTDLARQVRVIRSIYESVDDGGQVIDKRFVEWPYRWMYRFEAEHLLRRAGFEIEAVYGGYAGEAFTGEAPMMLLLASKPHS
jgi:ubiquinone/menaquinone biosynthesis C-methylase UbiE